MKKKGTHRDSRASKAKSTPPAPATSISLADLSADDLSQAIYNRLRGHAGVGPPVDPRVGPEPYRWLVEQFEHGDAGLQVRLTAVMRDFLRELPSQPERWPRDLRFALLDWIKAAGHLLVDDLHRLATEGAFLQNESLGVEAHAGLLKCLLALGCLESPEFWLDQLPQLGADYGALIFRGLAEHDLILAMRHLPQLAADAEARHMIRWGLPWLQNKYGLHDVLRQLKAVREQLGKDTYRLYYDDLTGELNMAAAIAVPSGTMAVART
jgi:hypothetical protein